MSENGDKNGSGNGGERDDKGRFLPGNPGGSGRGNTRKRQEISEVIESIKRLSQNDDLNLMDSEILNLIGRVILHDVTSKDTKTRIDSIKQFLSLLAKRIEAEEREKRDTGLSLGDIKSFVRLLSIKQDLDVMEAEGITDLLCFECKKKLGIPDEGVRNDN